MEDIQSDKTTNICIVGAGNMGYRHAQSLLNTCSTLFLIDLDIQRAEKVSELLESENPNESFSVIPLQSIPTVFIDFAIIATDSTSRLKTCQELIRKTAPDVIIIEKLLFDSLDNITEWQTISNNTNAFVNTPRRAYPIYKKLKYLTAEYSLKKVLVTGSNWNMASNSIHFLDLICFLANNGIDDKVLVADANLNWFKSIKREGFYEATGWIQGLVGSTNFEFISKEESCNLLIHLDYGTFVMEINETTKKVKLLSKKESQLANLIPENITLPYQSALTLNYWKEFKDYKKINSLPTLDESLKQHSALIEAFTDTFLSCNPNQALKIT